MLQLWSNNKWASVNTQRPIVQALSFILEVYHLHTYLRVVYLIKVKYNVYSRDTGGLMRPDHLINKTSNHPHNHNYLQNSSFKTNRYLTISNTTATNTNETNFSKEARNFHKSLRKPPKGIYLNYEELFDFVKAGSSNVFDELSRRTIALKKQVIQAIMKWTKFSLIFIHKNEIKSQVNKQDIDTLIKTITKECEPLKSEINVWNLFFQFLIFSLMFDLNFLL